MWNSLINCCIFVSHSVFRPLQNAVGGSAKSVASVVFGLGWVMPVKVAEVKDLGQFHDWVQLTKDQSINVRKQERRVRLEAMVGFPYPVLLLRVVAGHRIDRLANQRSCGFPNSTQRDFSVSALLPAVESTHCG